MSSSPGGGRSSRGACSCNNLGCSGSRGGNTESFEMASLKVGDLVELRAGTGTVGTVLEVVESQPRWLLVDWHPPPNTASTLWVGAPRSCLAGTRGHAASALGSDSRARKGEHEETKCRRVSFAGCPLVSGDWTDVQRNPPGDRFEPRRLHQCFLDRAHHEHRREFAGPLSRLLQHVRLTVPGPQLRSDRGVDLDPVTESNGQLPAHGADDWLHLQRLRHRRV